MGYNRIGTDGALTQAMWNGNIDDLELLGTAVVGRGVVSGLVLSDGGGLDVAISNGVVFTNKAATLSSIPDFTVADDQASYLWIDTDGTVTATASSAYPGGQVAGLGEVVAASGSITSITETGRDEIIRQVSKGQFGIGKTIELDDDAAEATIHGDVVVEGLTRLQGQLREPVLVQTLAATLQLDASSPNNLVLETDGSVRIVKLPTNAVMAALGDEGFGLIFRILNNDAAKEITIQTGAGAQVLTLPPSRYREFRPTLHASGHATFDAILPLGPINQPTIQYAGDMDIACYNGETTYTLPASAGTAPIAREVYLYFHRIRLPQPCRILGIWARNSGTPTPTSAKFRFAFYKDLDAAYRTPDVPLDVAGQVSATTWATATAGGQGVNFALDTPIEWWQWEDFVGRGVTDCWLATMWERYYTGDAEIAPAFPGRDVRFAPAFGVSFQKHLEYTPALSPNDITASFPTGIGGTLASFAEKNEAGVNWGIEIDPVVW